MAKCPDGCTCGKHKPQSAASKELARARMTGSKHTEETKQRIREGKGRYSASRQNEVEPLNVYGDKVVTLHTVESKVPFLIDAADYEAVSYYSWRYDNGYPETRTGVGQSKRGTRLHIFLLGYAPDGLEWDHRNRNTLDNRRENLRAVTHQINMLNRGVPINNSSGAVGVSPSGKKWRARIQIHGKSIGLGSFTTKEEAIAARRAAEEFYDSGVQS